MTQLVRALGHSGGPLGPSPSWPQSLRTALSICLASRHPLWVGWGPELTLLYNDAFRPVLGAKHPWALGKPVLEVWPEVGDIIGPMLRNVMDRGDSTWQDDQLLLLDRNGILEEAYFTYSYSPIEDDQGGIGGVFTAVSETTDRMLLERRLRMLRELAEAGAEANPRERHGRSRPRLWPETAETSVSHLSTTPARTSCPTRHGVWPLALLRTMGRGLPSRLGLGEVGR